MINLSLMKKMYSNSFYELMFDGCQVPHFSNVRFICKNFDFSILSKTDDGLVHCIFWNDTRDSSSFFRSTWRDILKDGSVLICYQATRLRSIRTLSSVQSHYSWLCRFFLFITLICNTIAHRFQFSYNDNNDTMMIIWYNWAIFLLGNCTTRSRSRLFSVLNAHYHEQVCWWNEVLDVFRRIRKE